MQRKTLETVRSLGKTSHHRSDSGESHLFTKTRRFPSNQAECPEAFYAFESLLSNRKTHIGFGKKSDFTKNSIVSPGSNRYNQYSPLGRSRKGGVFGTSREQSPDRSYLVPQIQMNPGVGQYDCLVHERAVDSKTIADQVSIASRKTKCSQLYKKDNCNMSGRYFLSNYRDAPYGKIDPNAQRFPTIKQSPGPSNYAQEDAREPQSYKLSNYRNKGQRRFDKQLRFTSSHWKTNETPGPGMYEASIDFKRKQFGHVSFNCK